MNNFIGVVEDNKDPQKLGRVRVRVFSYHSENLTDIKTEDLPWFQISMPLTSPGTSGLGSSPWIEQGSWVTGFWVDKFSQNGIILGTIPGKPEDLPNTTVGFNDPDGKYPSKVNESDIPPTARGISEKKEYDSVISETGANGTSKYLDNHVIIASRSGHLIEVDDTENNERINIRHKSGSWIEIQPNGNISIHSGDTFSSSTNLSIHTTEKVNIKADTECSIQTVKAKVKATEVVVETKTLTSVKSPAIKLDGNVTISGSLSFIPGSSNLTGPVEIRASKIRIISDNPVSVDGGMNIGGAINTADSVTAAGGIKILGPGTLNGRAIAVI